MSWNDVTTVISMAFLAAAVVFGPPGLRWFVLTILGAVVVVGIIVLALAQVF